MSAEHPAAAYARAVVSNGLSAEWVNVPPGELAPSYVKKQCAEFLRMWDGEHPAYFVDRDKLDRIGDVLSALKMAKGPRRGQVVAEALAGFQWLIIAALLCCVRRDDPSQRRYRSALLEICRKNGKTFIVAVLMLLLFVFEPRFSRFFSVAPDGSLAREIKEALEPLIEVNDEALEGDLDVRRDWIRSKRQGSEYRPLNYSTSRMDAKEVDVFVADEIGALPIIYPIEAMRSGQLMSDNPLGFCISTKYPTTDNPLETEVAYAKQVLDGVVEDEELFALLYEPDDTKAWATSDAVMAQGNPLALELERSWDFVANKRKKAVANEKYRENFVTKHLNICYQGMGTESYVSLDALRRCRAAREPDPAGETVWVGVDLAMTSDNCAVSWCWRDAAGNLCAASRAFFPADRTDEKSAAEKLDYRAMADRGWAVPCGDMVVSYDDVERFVLSIEEEAGCAVAGVGYDRYNCRSSAQKWEAAGMAVVEVAQHSSVLHAPTKLLAEAIESGRFLYGENDLLEANFANARCVHDTNLNRYVNKKKSNGKIDMVAALINAVCLMQIDELEGAGDFFVQS